MPSARARGRRWGTTGARVSEERRRQHVAMEELRSLARLGSTAS
ncbi:hypothetical protein TIFTF001_012043 [Ficus carica]|uniref:Uncharacterized protein n=1 Tax=Ficus carica TaxID=3494 RepID=A0AA88AMQ7_FICCA|nr:hypothetical protein TIFTF001_012043 [Ficus carica]